jgi:integration host factor subunit beta
MTETSLPVTRAELIARLAEHLPDLPAREVESAVRHLLDLLMETMAMDGRIEVRGFGAFRLHWQAARIGRNPRTGERVEVQPKARIHFKPGIELRERVLASAQIPRSGEKKGNPAPS